MAPNLMVGQRRVHQIGALLGLAHGVETLRRRRTGLGGRTGFRLLQARSGGEPHLDAQPATRPRHCAHTGAVRPGAGPQVDVSVFVEFSAVCSAPG